VTVLANEETGMHMLPTSYHINPEKMSGASIVEDSRPDDEQWYQGTFSKYGLGATTLRLETFMERLFAWMKLGTRVEEDLPRSERHPFLPEGYDHSPFMDLGNTGPGTKGMSVAAHEVSEGRGYLVVVFAGEEAMDPVVVSALPSLPSRSASSHR
jgi:hypothetical protein